VVIWYIFPVLVSCCIKKNLANLTEAYFEGHPSTLRELGRAHLDVEGDGLQAEDEVEVGAAKVGLMHVPENKGGGPY
jgi:hypothetical protein